MRLNNKVAIVTGGSRGIGYATVVYVTNFIGGAACGVVIAMMGMVNNSPGTATAIAGLAVSFAYNPPVKVLICALICAVLSAAAGLLGYAMFKNYKITTADEIRGEANQAA